LFLIAAKSKGKDIQGDVGPLEGAVPWTYTPQIQNGYYNDLYIYGQYANNIHLRQISKSVCW